MNSSPLISFCILTYNQSLYIEDALKGAINQTYEHLEIIVSDDGSKDDTYDKICRFFRDYKGPHRIILNKNETNLGIREHYNKVVYDIARGDIIIIAAGDDVSLPNRASYSVEFFRRHPEVQSLHFRSLQVNSVLEPLDTNRTMCKGMYTIMTLDDYVQSGSEFWLFSGDSRALRRNVVEKFPRLEICKNEDLPTFIRSIMLGPTAMIREPYVLRRIDGNNTSLILRFNQEGKNLSKQLYNDVAYALSNHYVTKEAAIELYKKIDNVIVDMKFIDVRRIFPPIIYLYKAFVILPRMFAKLF